MKVKGERQTKTKESRKNGWRIELQCVLSASLSVIKNGADSVSSNQVHHVLSIIQASHPKSCLQFPNHLIPSTLTIHENVLEAKQECRDRKGLIKALNLNVTNLGSTSLTHGPLSVITKKKLYHRNKHTKNTNCQHGWECQQTRLPKIKTTEKEEKRRCTRTCRPLQTVGKVKKF